MTRSSNHVKKPVSDDITGFRRGMWDVFFSPQRRCVKSLFWGPGFSIVDLYGKAKVLQLLGLKTEEVHCQSYLSAVR